MIDDTIGERLETLLRDTRISPRVLSLVTKVHYTSIYSLMRDRERDASPLTLDVLNKALNKMQKLLDEGKLPFDGKLKQSEQSERLKLLFNDD